MNVVGMRASPESAPPFGGTPCRNVQRGCPPPFQVGLTLRRHRNGSMYARLAARGKVAHPMGAGGMAMPSHY